MSDEKFHTAGATYCNCPRGVDHESNDREADEAWDLHGPMGLAELYSKRKDARIANLEAGRDVEQHALRNALGIIQQLEADLARALPVVEAAGAVVEQLKYWGGAPVGVPEWRAACDALAAAVRAAREPRTGEGT